MSNEPTEEREEHRHEQYEESHRGSAHRNLVEVHDHEGHSEGEGLGGEE